MPFYAVRRGIVPGIYTTWDEAKAHVMRFRKPEYKKFDTREEAQAFMDAVVCVKGVGLKEEKINAERDSDSSANQLPTGAIPCFTDGSTIRNGSKNAKGGFAVVWPEAPRYNYAKHLCPCTNNLAELSAVEYALQFANEVIDPSGLKPLAVYTDSTLVIKSVSLWMDKWKKNNWKKSDGKTVLNLEVLKRIDELKSVNSRKLVFIHVKAHTSSTSWEADNNRLADEMARNAALGR